jgi:geranylgeranyl reductase family protein
VPHFTPKVHNKSGLIDVFILRYAEEFLMHDLIVVGGGPAGAACARRAALHGLSVLLLEKENYPRPKLCGGAINPRVNELVDFDLTPILERTFHAASIYAPSGRRVDCIRQDISGHTVKRTRFDKFLIEKAEEVGVEVLQDSRVLGVEQVKSGIRVLVHGDSYKGHLLVGADGVNGIVAKECDIRSKWENEKIGLCIAADVPMEPNELERVMAIPDTDGILPIEMYFGIRNWGYAWCFPKRAEISIGVGCRLDKAINLREAWKIFIKDVEEVKGAQFDVTNRSAFRVPLGGPEPRIVARRTMLVGDAAGLVSPITGEGIYHAMASGILAADVAKETVNLKNPRHIWEYDHRIRKSIVAELESAKYVARILYKSKKNLELVIKIAAKDNELRDLMIDFVIGGSRTKRPLRALGKRLLRHHPIDAVRLGLSR